MRLRSRSARASFPCVSRRLALAWVACGALALPLVSCGEASDPPVRADRQEARPLPPLPPQQLPSGATVTPLGYEAELAARVAAVDMDGDGREEIAVASAREIAVVRVEGDGAAVVWTGRSRGGATAVASADLDDDGRRDLVIGWGVHRDHLDAEARLVAYRSAGGPPDTWLEEVVAAPTTSRAQFSSIQPTSLASSPMGTGRVQGLLYAHFVSKYEVRGAFAALRGASRWSDRGLHRIRMGSELVAAPSAPDDTPLLVVGRPYGDEIKSHGDVFVMRDDGERIPLESVRGVRSLAALRLGPAEAPLALVCYGDGWHWRYRDEARGYLTCARQRADGTWASERVAETEGYSVASIAEGDLDGDGAAELLAQGPVGLYRFVPEARPDGSLAWTGGKIGPGGTGLAVVDVEGDGRDEIALAGERPALLRWEPGEPER